MNELEVDVLDISFVVVIPVQMFHFALPVPAFCNAAVLIFSLAGPFFTSDADARHGLEQQVVGSVEQKPEYPGGNKALYTYISSHLKYPSEARKMGAQGVVHLQFVVAADGAVGDVVVKRSDNPLLDDEAVRVVRSLPKWKPGMNQGQAVPVTMLLPISFQLGDDR